MRKLRILLPCLAVTAVLGCGHENPVTNSVEPRPNITVDTYSSPGMDPNFDVYRVRLLWGQLHNVPIPGPAQDWSGVFQLHAIGQVILSQEIDFEEGEDYVHVLNSIDKVAWVSHVQQDVDGLDLTVYFDKRPLYFHRPWLTFESASLSCTVFVDQLASLDTLIMATNSSGLLIHSRAQEHHCSRGPVEGSWEFKDDHHSGVFSSTWYSTNVLEGGYFNGSFATSSDGTQKLEGAWQSYDGALIGIVRGSWHFLPAVHNSPDNRPWGLWHGVILTPDSESPAGGVGGVFGPNPADNVSLKMRGHWFWGEECLDVAQESQD